MSENTTDAVSAAEVVDDEIAELLRPTANVADTEHITGSSKALETDPDAALIAENLVESWSNRQALPNGKECGTRVRIPRVFNGKGDLEDWKRRTRGDIQRMAYDLGFSTRNTGPNLGWAPAIHKGQHVRTAKGAVYFLYLRTVTRGSNAADKDAAPDVKAVSETA